MQEINYYDRLGVSKTATLIEIKKKYRDLCKKYHPDVNSVPWAEQEMKEINEAYDILRNATKRQAYDEHLKRLEELKNIDKKTAPTANKYTPINNALNDSKPKWTGGSILFVVIIVILCVSFLFWLLPNIWHELLYFWDWLFGYHYHSRSHRRY